MARTLLGKISGMASRKRVYLVDGALEVDEIESYVGTRKRVFFDEVVLVTHDRRRRLPTLVGSAGLALICLVIGGAISSSDTRGHGRAAVTAFTMLFLASPFVVWFLLHLLRGVDYVTVFGKRTKAQMEFFLRKRRAQAVFAQICERVGQAQEAGRRRLAVPGSAPPAPPGRDGTAGAA